MVRFFIGLLLGVILTAEALAIGGVGHGTYAPLVFTASLTVLIPPFRWYCWLISVQVSGLRMTILHLLEQTRRGYWSLESQFW